MSAWEECDEAGCDEPAEVFVPRERSFLCEECAGLKG